MILANSKKQDSKVLLCEIIPGLPAKCWDLAGTGWDLAGTRWDNAGMARTLTIQAGIKLGWAGTLTIYAGTFLTEAGVG